MHVSTAGPSINFVSALILKTSADSISMGEQYFQQLSEYVGFCCGGTMQSANRNMAVSTKVLGTSH
jgi:hypothetical protein